MSAPVSARVEFIRILGGFEDTHLAACSRKDGLLEVFAKSRGPARQAGIYTNHYNTINGWKSQIPAVGRPEGTWDLLGMSYEWYLTGISAVSWGGSRIDIFGVKNQLLPAGDGHPEPSYSPVHPLMHYWFDGHNWSGPEYLGPTGEYRTLSVMGVSACSWGEGRLDVFALESHSSDLTMNQGLLHRYYDNGQWSRWERLSDNNVGSKPAAVSWGEGRIDVFAKRGDGQRGIMHKWFDYGTWSDWEYIDAHTYPYRTGQPPIQYVLEGVAACSRSAGSLDVFIGGGDLIYGGILMQKTYENDRWAEEWSVIRDRPTEGLNIVVGGPPCAVAMNTSRIDIFGVSSDRRFERLKPMVHAIRELKVKGSF